MKLILIFNGAQTAASKISQIITAAGANTSVVVNTAQTISVNDWSTIKQAAGNNKNLLAQFNGAQTSLSFMQLFFSGSGTNTSASLNTAQTWNPTNLASLASSVGSKHLSVDFNGAQSMLSNIQPMLSVAGTNTNISMNTAQIWNPPDLVTLANAAGSKHLSVDFDGAQSMLPNIQPLVSAAGVNTNISMNSAQIWNPSDLVTLANAAGSKHLSIDFNGAQSMLPNIQPLIGAAGTNTTVSLNTAQNWNSGNLVILANSAGSKKLSVSFDGAQSMLHNIQPLVAGAGLNTSVSMNSAQIWNPTDLVTLANSAGSKRLSVEFNGAQTPLTTIQPFVTAAGVNTTVTINTAQEMSESNLLTLVSIAG